MSQTYMELQTAYLDAVKTLRLAIDNAFHDGLCPSNMSAPTTFDDDLMTCQCWIKAADKHIRSHLYKPKETGIYLTVLDGPECSQCGHTAGSHCNGGTGLCSNDGCDCFSFKRKKT